MRMFMAALVTETNSFAPMPTGLGSFQEYGIFHGDASTSPQINEGGPLLRIWRRRAEAAGIEVAEGLCAFAQPAGRTLAPVWEDFRAELLDGLAQAGPVDMVLLLLHGAMMAVGQDDCEGALLAAIRAQVGPDVVIGVELDPHCHLSPAMLDSADVLIAMKEYPHTDGLERADELFDLCLRAARREIRPVMRDFDCRMITLYPTTVEPMLSFVRDMQTAQRQDGILSVSLAHGFPWGDTPWTGTRVWAVTDGDAGKAAFVARTFGERLYREREALRPAAIGLDTALEKILAAPRVPGRPAVIADVADNPGGGAPGDSTFILRRLLDRGIGNAAIGCFWDLGAINICVNAGIGSHFDLRLGGKCGPASGDPVDLPVTVRNILPAHTQMGLDGEPTSLGLSVWLEGPGGLQIVLASQRSQVFQPDVFTGLGIDLSGLDLIVVKSTQHFHAGFAPLASSIHYVSTPGAIAPAFATIPYRTRALDFWPRVADPLGLDA
ncbi:M81 family metallopeptidase [Niveispirillum sp. KHB5.9]|uniref:M81 family metallopeptidase n=1 Tax=Niveispirillum sp. KHB5.9 TaxID=3400269 RepID=UPI003A843819